MVKWLRIVFLVHMVVAAVVGAGLMASPDRFLGLLGWVTKTDVVISRLLGAALLALAWASFRGWRARERTQVGPLIEVQAGFAILGALSVLWFLVTIPRLWVLWVLFAVLCAFAIAWVVALLKK